MRVAAANHSSRFRARHSITVAPDVVCKSQEAREKVRFAIPLPSHWPGAALSTASRPVQSFSEAQSPAPRALGPPRARETRILLRPFLRAATALLRRLAVPRLA